ncbi:MAG TPA: hypothetical protein VFC24_02450 [Casimicrobiaceae bacterium]|nr:hypothetical protein [Casimicrobiaceae bacterium]
MQQAVQKPLEQPRIAEEIQKMAYEPLLPIEKKLIGWSLGLGIGLLVVLYFVARTFVKVAT